MSQKELPRGGLVPAAVAGRISNREGAEVCNDPRQFQRLKQRFRVGGAGALRHQARGRPSHRRLPVTVATQAQVLLRDALGVPAVHRRRPQHCSRRAHEQAAGQTPTCRVPAGAAGTFRRASPVHG
jgi:hypothetical protein